MLSDNRVILNDFMVNYEFNNFVTQPTREVFRKKNQSKKIYFSSTLLDVVLHNGSYVKDTWVCGYSFSDFCSGQSEM